MAVRGLAGTPTPRPMLAEGATPFMQMEREVEIEFRPRLLEALQDKVDRAAEALRDQSPVCGRCRKPMGYHDAWRVSWLSRYGRLRARPARFRCKPCEQESRPLLDYLGVEPGRICGSLARLLAVLGVVVPYVLAAQLAELLLGVKVSPMSVWRVVQRLGEAAERYTGQLSAPPCQRRQRRGGGGGSAGDRGDGRRWFDAGNAAARHAAAPHERR